MVFAMDSAQEEFVNWLHEAWIKFSDIVKEDPIRFKVTGRHGPLFTQHPITPSRDPQLYPDELRCRLLTRDQVCIAKLMLIDGEDDEPVDPANIWRNGFVTPVIKLGYFKDGDEFGLTLTILKGVYEPTTQNHNVEWMIDEKVVGGGSSSSAFDGSVVIGI